MIRSPYFPHNQEDRKIVTACIYKILTTLEWAEMQAAGRFVGSPADRRDGYIHLSKAGQVETTANKHFAGQSDLMLITVDAAALGGNLKWEPARGGELFPHLYAPLELTAVVEACALARGADGRHVLPEEISEC